MLLAICVLALFPGRRLAQLHVSANPLDPGLYPQALWTFFGGLLFGVVREKCGSIFPPALLHGVLNYSPQALLFDLIS